VDSDEDSSYAYCKAALTKPFTLGSLSWFCFYDHKHTACVPFR